MTRPTDKALRAPLGFPIQRPRVQVPSSPPFSRKVVRRGVGALSGETPRLARPLHRIAGYSRRSLTFAAKRADRIWATAR